MLAAFLFYYILYLFVSDKKSFFRFLFYFYNILSEKQPDAGFYIQRKPSYGAVLA